MAELTTLARPYAKAAFEYAQANKDLAGWSAMLATAAAVAQQDVIQQVISLPSYTADQKAQIFVDVCGDQLTGPGQNFIKNLAANKRLPLLPHIAAIYGQLKAEQEKSIDVEVVSAFTLSADLQEKLATALSKKLSCDVRVQASVDKNLIGGAIIRAGDTVIDGSVRGRLAKLAEAMNA